MQGFWMTVLARAVPIPLGEVSAETREALRVLTEGNDTSGVPSGLTAEAGDLRGFGAWAARWTASGEWADNAGFNEGDGPVEFTICGPGMGTDDRICLLVDAAAHPRDLCGLAELVDGHVERAAMEADSNGKARKAGSRARTGRKAVARCS